MDKVMVTVKVYTSRGPRTWNLLGPAQVIRATADRHRPVMLELWQVQYISVFFDRGHVLWLLLPSSVGTHTKFGQGSAHYSEGFVRTRRANPRAQSAIKYP